MNFEALVLACGMLTYEQAVYVLKHEQEYNVRAVACAINRWKQEQPKPAPLKSLRDIPNLKPEGK